jgi:hypothetical protein
MQRASDEYQAALDFGEAALSSASIPLIAAALARLSALGPAEDAEVQNCVRAMERKLQELLELLEKLKNERDREIIEKEVIEAPAGEDGSGSDGSERGRKPDMREPDVAKLRDELGGKVKVKKITEFREAPTSKPDKATEANRGALAPVPLAAALPLWKIISTKSVRLPTSPGIEIRNGKEALGAAGRASTAPTVSTGIAALGIAAGLTPRAFATLKRAVPLLPQGSSVRQARPIRSNRLAANLSAHRIAFPGKFLRINAYVITHLSRPKALRPAQPVRQNLGRPCLPGRFSILGMWIGKTAPLQVQHSPKVPVAVGLGR